MAEPALMAAVEFASVDIVFGQRVTEALAMLDRAAGREEVIAATHCVPGAIDVNLKVERGEICVLMGLSGSGKSTILRAINRLNTVARGSVFVEFEGRRIDVTTANAVTLRELRTRAVAMVFQQFALLPWRTVRENVGFGLEIRGVPAAERARIVDEKLALVGLSGWGDKFSHELSGGMQQRVGLARAFATDADILLMDEPFSALDPLIRDKLQDELLDLQRSLKKTIVFVSHDLDEALKLGNTIAILEGGRVVQNGTAEDILLRPANAYVAEFVKHMNPLNVLRGTSVMTPASALPREDGHVIVADGAIRIRVDAEERPVGAFLNGREARLAVTDAETGALNAADSDMIIAPVNLTLRAAIALKAQTEHPILLVDQLGRLAGLCGHEEIYSGLLRRERS
jgi:glycine betaine/proline transport system ATP-binding protein